MEINIPDGFTNDGTFKCSQCEEGIMCFSTTCDTQFCPNCGMRNIDFDDWEGSD